MSKTSKVVIKPLFIDFEFNKITSEEVNLVSCVTYDGKTTKRYWLHNSEVEQARLASDLRKHKLIFGYSCVAEARSFYSLNLNPLDWEWIDGFLEYRMLSNHNDQLNWGQQLVDGVVKSFKKPKSKWERTEEESKNSFRPTHSLAEATFKLTGEIRDTKEKDEVRKLIISAPSSFTKEERKRILDYNEQDVVFLETLWTAIQEEFQGLHLEPVDWEQYYEEAKWRGRYAAHTAIMESIGYPIDYDKTRNFSKQLQSILSYCQRDINSQFPDNPPFKWKKKEAKFSWDQKKTREWLKSNVDISNWMETDKGALSLSLEAFERVFQFKHDYPRGNFGAQMVRYLKLKQSLFGFTEKPPGSDKKSFWDSVGPDKRVRPYMNIYGAQSGRSQPGSTGFMFLKPAWMRALVVPKEGHWLAGVDYGQQEFFLAGLLSEDEEMIQAYLSGDPYLYMGKQVGMIPPEGTKDSHSNERELMKSTTLGILFGMSRVGLSNKLSADTGNYYSEDEAQGFIEMFEGLYQRYIEWREEKLSEYLEGNSLTTLDGWRLWCDNDNPRSVLNVPVQGGGAAIMRKAVDLAVEKGCRVIFTLHDAIYIEGKTGKEKHIVLLMDAMREAFEYFFEGTQVEQYAGHIKLDPKAWGLQFPENGTMKIGDVQIPVSRLHIDKRSKADYERFSKYFEAPDSDLL